MTKNSNLLFIPAFPEDETINSYVSRCAIYNSCNTVETGFKKILGTIRSTTPSVPSSINTFCSIFGPAVGSAEDILRNHTLFDFYACGLWSNQVSDWKRRLTSEKLLGPSRPSRLPLLFTPTNHEMWRCPECDRESLERFGFCYSQRQLTAPFIEYCPKHHCRLSADKNTANYYDFNCKGGGPRIVPADMIDYAQRVATCVKTKALHSPCRREALLKLCSEQGWLSTTSRFAIAPFIAAFQKRFAGAFLDTRLHYLCSNDKYINNAIRALQRHDRHLHPVWCILMEWLLQEVRHSPRSGTSTHSQKVTKLEISKEVLSRAIAKAGSIRGAALHLERDVGDVVALARRYEIAFTSRSKSITMEIREKIISLLQEGHSVATVAKKSRVSIKSVYRVASACPVAKVERERKYAEARLANARKDWQLALLRFPADTITQVRHHCRGAWTYLYRHDRAWLEEHSTHRNLPYERPSAAHCVQLSQLAKEALTTAAMSSAAVGRRPTRVSGYRLQKQTGVSEYLLRSQTSPLKEFTDIVVEDQYEFAYRRLRWAYSKEALAAPSWQLARDASLAQSTLKKFFSTTSESSRKRRDA